MVRVGRHPAVATLLALVALAPAALGLSAAVLRSDACPRRLSRPGRVDRAARLDRPTRSSCRRRTRSRSSTTTTTGRCRPSACRPSGRSTRPTRSSAWTRIKAHYDRIWLVSWAMSEADPNGVISDLAGRKRLSGDAPVVRLGAAGAGRLRAGQRADQKVDAALDNGIVLDGYRLASRTLKPGETLALTLVWRAAGGPTLDRWKVFTHLLDSGSKVVAQRDAEPADNLRPTTSWKRGEQIEDNYGIAVPDDLPPAATRSKSACTTAKSARRSTAKPTTWSSARCRMLPPYQKLRLRGSEMLNRAALAWLAFGPDAAVVAGHDLFADVQAQAHAAACAAKRGLRPGRTGRRRRPAD